MICFSNRIRIVDDTLRDLATYKGWPNQYTRTCMIRYPCGMSWSCDWECSKRYYYYGNSVNQSALVESKCQESQISTSAASFSFFGKGTGWPTRKRQKEERHLPWNTLWLVWNQTDIKFEQYASYESNGTDRPVDLRVIRICRYWSIFNVIIPQIPAAPYSRKRDLTPRTTLMTPAVVSILPQKTSTNWYWKDWLPRQVTPPEAISRHEWISNCHGNCDYRWSLRWWHGGRIVFHNV